MARRTFRPAPRAGLRPARGAEPRPASDATPRRGPVLIVMAVGMFLVLLDVTVVNVALPALGGGLHADLAVLQWVVDGYSVPFAALLLAGGTLGDLYGHRVLVVAGLVVFGLASAACGLAPGVPVLIGARALQGVGAALLLPGTLAVITHMFPGRREQARALGIWAGVSSLALPAGPLLGGLMVTATGWRAVFLANPPIVAAALVATLRWARATAPARTRRLDVAGLATGTVALAAAVYAVIDAGRNGAATLAAAIVAVVGVAAFVVAERRAADPVLPLRLLRVPAFVGANTVAGAMNFVGLGTVFVLTLYLQVVQHRTALLAGLAMVPLFAPLALLSPVAGRLAAAYGPAMPMAAGLLVGAAGLSALWLTSPTSGYVVLVPTLLGLGIGMGLLTAAVVAAALRAVPAERSGLAGGVNNTARQAAGALGVAVFGAVAGSPGRPVPFVAGLHRLGLLGAALWLAAMALAVVSTRRTTATATRA